MDGKISTTELLENKYFRFYNSQHYEDWDERFFCKYNLTSLLSHWEKMDPDVVIATARTHNGHWFCDIGMGQQHAGLKGVDQLQALIDYARSKNKPVIAYFSTVYDKILYEMHPEWRQVDVTGEPLAKSSGSWGKIVCLNSPYRQYLIEMINRLLGKYDLDGIFFDMVFFQEKPCYCKSCADKFRSIYNAGLPEEEDWDDPVYRKFVQFRIDTNYQFVREICEAVKNAGSHLSTAVQYILLRGQAYCSQTIALGREADYVYSDLYFQNGYLPLSVITRLAASISKIKPEIGIMTRPGTHDDTPNMKTLDHIRSEAFTVLANGGAISFFDITWADGTLQDAMWDRIKQVGSEVKMRENWLGGNPAKSVAVFYSEKTRIWHGRDKMFERYDCNLFGMCRALIEEHIPFNFLTSLDEQTLTGCQVLVLPNAACMTSAESTAVRSFVEKGGGLVCTEMTSLYNESGHAMEDYSLAEVLGISHVGDTSGYSRVYSKFDTSHKIAMRIPADGYMTSWGTLQKAQLKGARALANIYYPYLEPTGDRFANIMANPPAVASEWAACTYHEFGMGRAIYFTGGIDKDYLKLSFPELKWLIADAVRFVANDDLPITMKAPACVELTAFVKEEGRQLVLHLVNFQPGLGRGISAGTFSSRQQIQEILPVYDLELKFKMTGKIAEVRLQPENLALDYEIAGEYAVVSIPRLYCHSMVVVDYFR